MIWDLCTSEEINQIDKGVPVILPMSATEQHGSHLPLATDRLIGEYFAYKLHEVMPKRLLVLPTVSVGCSKHHMNFSGTLTLRHQTFMRQVEDILKSVLEHGFRSFLLLNSHGGNQGVGQVVLEKLGSSYPEAKFVLITWWKMVSDELQEITETGFGGTGHAGEFETSLIMHIAPELVRNDSIEAGENISTFRWAEGDMLSSPEGAYYRSMDQMTPNGIYGDPTSATAEKGKKITKLVLDKLKKIIDDLHRS